MPKVVVVALPLPLPVFDFLLPPTTAAPAVGVRVVVPWQQGIRVGIVTAVRPARSGETLDRREIITCLDTKPFISDKGIAFLEAIAHYALAPIGLVLRDLLHLGLNPSLAHEVRALDNTEGVALPEDRWNTASNIQAQELEFYRRQGLIEERAHIIVPTQQRLIPIKQPDSTLEGKRQHKQRQALMHLWQLGSAESAAALAREADVSTSSVSTLIKKGYVTYESRPAPPPALPQYPPTETPISAPALAPLPELGAGFAMCSISGGWRHKRLLGLLPYFKEALARDQHVLILVPEGAYLQEAAQLLGGHVPLFTFDSSLNDAQRLRSWEELQIDPCVVIGTYVAVLAPVVWGAVVVLEHGSSSYKLLAGTRLFVPRAAKELAKLHEAPLLLCDALNTPEILYQTSEEQQLELPSPSQRVHLINMNHSANWPLSPELILVLKQVQERKRQAVLITSRRGYSAALHCRDCGWFAPCPNCDLHLRYHQQKRLLRCHQCNYQIPPPQHCPECHSHKIVPTRAAGTEWVLRALHDQLPDLARYRFDTDQRDDLTPLYNGDSGVLVATTAALRLAPLPNVSLIAHTLLDTHFISDYRASEDTLRLLLNLPELAPEKRPLTLLQTFKPDHPTLIALSDGEPQEFLQGVLERRQRFHYPPFSILAKIQISHKLEATAYNSAQWLAKALHTHGVPESQLLGPSPAPIQRLKGLYHYQLFVRADTAELLRTLLEPALSYRGSSKLKIDVDPRELLSFIGSS